MNPQEIAFGSYMNSAVTGSSYMNPQEIAFGSYMNLQEIAFGSYRKQIHEELGSYMNSAVAGSCNRKNGTCTTSCESSVYM